MFKILMLAVFCMILLVTGQTLLKIGLNQIGGIDFLGGAVWDNFWKIFRTPYIILGFAIYGISAVLWLDVLSKLDLSMAFPMMSLSYIFTLLVGAFVFGETVTWIRILGVACICGGMFFLIKSQ